MKLKESKDWVFESYIICFVLNDMWLNILIWVVLIGDWSEILIICYISLKILIWVFFFVKGKIVFCGYLFYVCV